VRPSDRRRQLVSRGRIARPTLREGNGKRLAGQPSWCHGARGATGRDMACGRRHAAVLQVDREGSRTCDLSGSILCWSGSTR
jgi:hypothetical protein